VTASPAGAASLPAPAKVNLFLHVGAPGADGFHPLVSLMTFADLGDRLTAVPAPGLALSIEGAFAAGLSAGEDNLVMRAARALVAHAGLADAPWRLVLDKQLPVASGLGGGSADAGAALRLLDRVMALRTPEAVLETLAAGLGADGAACLRARPLIAEGRGERLSPAPSWPVLPCVLVNPGAASSTPAVYAALDRGGRFGDLARPVLGDADDPRAVAAMLAPLRNDLQAPAILLEAAIGEALAALDAEAETLLARVSGSGGSCFALCADTADAARLAARLSRAHPGWWVRPCQLGG